MKNSPSTLMLLAAAFAGLATGSESRAAAVSEPETVFYGRIINRISGPTYVMSEGALSWRLRRSNGTLVTLTAQLQPLKDGTYSYRLNVPHQALGLGLQASSSGTVPLSAQPTTVVHEQISVEGYPAAILAPGSDSFTFSQSGRARTCRLDLEVTNPLSDLDEDGIADWWQNRYSVGDPNADSDGDGRSNLSEFLNGSDPNRDDRAPSLATQELRAYADGTTAVLLRAIDTDSSPINLTYTLAEAPEAATLYLRNTTAGGDNHDSALAIGATFSQADVNAGRVVLVHPGDSMVSGNLQVVLRDENASHPACTGTVAVTFYRPATTPSTTELTAALSVTPRLFPVLTGMSVGEEPMAAGYVLSREMGFIVADGADEALSLNLAAPSSGLTASDYQSQYMPNYGADRHYLFLGGAGSDHLSGSMQSDVLIGGRGPDSLRGGGGADLFVFCTTSDGNDLIEDFTIDEGDVIDVARLLTGSSPWATNYLSLAVSGTNSQLRLSFNGTAGSYSDMTLTLAGATMSQGTFLALVESGQIYTGGKVLAPRVTVVASQPDASENGPVSGEFTLTRSGPLGAALTVNLQFTGSAVNGSDYAFINPQATFLPGNRSLTVQINPNVDAVTELGEVVDLAVLASPGYELGGTPTARVTIEDLAPQIAIETLEPVAVKSDLTPGVILVSRAGILDRSVLVRLSISGTASATDYQGVPTFINLQPGQATALIYVTPRPTAVLSGGTEFVQVTIQPDSTYKVAQPSRARVTLVEEMISFPLWRERFFSAVPGDLAAFAAGDIGLTGVQHFQRYAFGLDPSAPQTSPGRPLFQIRDGHLTVQFRCPASLTDVQYAVEVSEDLVTWHAGDSYVKPFAVPELANQPETAAYRVERSIGEAQTMFMRIRPVYAP